MKYRYGALLFLSIIFQNIQSAPECLDRSWHLQKSNDSKSYHSVSCNCPCGSYSSNGRYKIIANRNMCIECRHFRISQPLPIVHNHHNTIEPTQNTKIHPKGMLLHSLFKKEHN